MIKTSFKYVAYSPKKTKSNKTMFSIQDYDPKNTGAKRYCTVFCSNDIEVYDKQKVIIMRINAISLGEYNGKLQVAMFADIELADDEVQNVGSFSQEKTVDAKLKEMSGNKINEIDSDSLPF